MSERDVDGGTVLIVDDDPDILALYGSWLSTEYDVRTAETAADGLDRLDPSVDVVLLDRRMPGTSGDELAAAIADRDLTCPVIAVSAVAPRLEVLDLAIDDYVTKPVSEDELKARVARMQRVASIEDDDVRAYLAQVAQRTVLDDELSPTARRTSERYRAFEAELDDRRARLEAQRGAPVPEDPRTAFRELL